MSQVAISGNASGTGTLTIAAPNTNSNYTLTLPAATGTVASIASVNNNGVVYANSSGQPTTGTAFVFDGTNVGIGTSSPKGKITVLAPSSVTLGDEATSALNIIGNNGTGKFWQVGFGAYDTSFTYAPAAIGYVQTQASGYNYGDLVFATRNVVTDTAPTERMRIDSSGNLLVGSSSFANTQLVNVNGAVFSQTGGFQSWAGGYNGYNSTNNYFGVQFFKAATSSLSGNVRQGVLEMQFDNFLQLKTDAALPIKVIAGASNGVQLASGGTSWTSLSDERYKTDLKSIENASVKVSSLRAVTGRFLTDEDSKSRSFLIAQDVQSVFPEAVDATNLEQLGLSYTDVIPLLVAAIKEQQGFITQLQADVAALKGK